MFSDGKHHVFDLSIGLAIDRDHFDIAEGIGVIMDDMAVQANRLVAFAVIQHMNDLLVFFGSDLVNINFVGCSDY